MSHATNPLDEIEQAILYHLQADARNVTNTEISEHVDVSATTVGQRIADLEARGIIENYHTMVDYERSGFPHRILLRCTVPPDDRRETADELIDQHRVISVRELIAGNRNLNVEIVGHTRDELVETIATIERAGATVVDSEIIKNELRRPFDGFQPG